MNYERHYNNLINRAKNRLLEGYTEKHHIVPRCMGGSDWIDNIVSLTPEEHYVAHQLLIKIYPDNKKLVYAAHMMTVGRNNKLHGWLRRKLSKLQKGNTYGNANKGRIFSEGHKQKINPLGRKHTEKTKQKQSEAKKGEKNHFYGKKHTEDSRQQMSESHKGNTNGTGNKGKSWSLARRAAYEKRWANV